MTTKQAAPATPLPWREGPASTVQSNALGIRGIWTQDKRTGVGEAFGPRENAAYIVAACNAYPRLMAERAALRALIEHQEKTIIEENQARLRLAADRAELVAALRLGRSADDHLKRQALLARLGAE